MTTRSDQLRDDFLQQVHSFVDETLPEHGIERSPTQTDLLLKSFTSKPVSCGSLSPQELEDVAVSLQRKFENVLEYHGLDVHISSSVGFSPTYVFRFVYRA